MKNSVEVYYDKSKLQIPLFLFSSLLVLLPFEVASLLFTFFNHSARFVKYFLPFVIGGLLIFSIPYYYLFITFKYWFKKYTLKKPVLIIDQKGIAEKMNFAPIGFIPWSNIKKISAFSSRGHYLVFFIEDIKEITSKFTNKRKKRKAEAYFKKNGANIRIALKFMDGNIYTLKKFAQTKLDVCNKELQANAMVS